MSALSSVMTVRMLSCASFWFDTFSRNQTWQTARAGNNSNVPDTGVPRLGFQIVVLLKKGVGYGSEKVDATSQRCATSVVNGLTESLDIRRP